MNWVSKNFLNKYNETKKNSNNKNTVFGEKRKYSVFLNDNKSNNSDYNNNKMNHSLNFKLITEKNIRNNIQNTLNKTNVSDLLLTNNSELSNNQRNSDANFSLKNNNNDHIDKIALMRKGN